jgi:hypothetical protein
VLPLNLGAIVGFGQCNSLVRPKYLLFQGVKKTYWPLVVKILRLTKTF